MRKLLILLILLTAGPVHPADKLNIDNIENDSYLPLSFTILKNSNSSPRAEEINGSIFVVKPIFDTLNQAEFVSMANQIGSLTYPTTFSHESFPERRNIDDDNIYLTVKTCRQYFDNTLGKMAIFGIGYRNDSAFAFKHLHEESTFDLLFLGTGEDDTGDGSWTPFLLIHLIDDYDYDGRTEIFVFISSERDIGPRDLICIEPEQMTIEWSIEMPGNAYKVFSCNDSINPSVIISKNNPMQGYSNEFFSDFYKTISIVNNRGEILLNKITAVRPSGKGLVPSETEGEFFLIHETPLLDRDSADFLLNRNKLNSLYYDKLTLSRIDGKGNLLNSKIIDGFISYIWTQPYGPDEKPILFTLCTENIVRAYDADINLIGESDPVGIRNYHGEIKLAEYGRCFVYGDGIYTGTFEKLMAFPSGIGKYHTIVFNSDSSSNTLVIEAGYERIFGRIDKKSMIDLATVFYHNNQTIVLMILSGLMVGLISINHYRSRTKRNLDLISSQKKELEEVHEALKVAQQKIIEQEKYRQAKDIAGGFAHEIRNALFPAQSALTKLEKSIDIDKKKLERLSGLSSRAVNRAISLTRQISNYTRLESIKKNDTVVLSEVVEQVVNDNAPQIADNNIAVNFKGNGHATIFGDKEQLYIMFNNLLLNSIRAVSEKNNPEITIEFDKDDGAVSIDFSDNGCGIDPEHLDKIFDVFFSTDPDSGTGLGLAMVRKIVESHHGEITVASTAAKDTTFTINLPTT